MELYYSTFMFYFYRIIFAVWMSDILVHTKQDALNNVRNYLVLHKTGNDQSI